MCVLYADKSRRGSLCVTGVIVRVDVKNARAADAAVGFDAYVCRNVKNVCCVGDCIFSGENNRKKKRKKVKLSCLYRMRKESSDYSDDGCILLRT